MEMSEGTLIVDQRCEVRFCSTALARLLGRSPRELAGHPLGSLLCGWTPYSGTVGKPARLRAADGSQTPVQVACEVLHVPGGPLYAIEIRVPAHPS